MAEIISVADDRLAFRAGKPPVISSMTTAEVEKTIDALGRCRAKMLPSIPMTWERGQLVECFRDPAMEFEGEQLAGDVVWHVQHELYGWLHFVISKERAAELALGFAAAAAAAPPRPQGSA